MNHDDAIALLHDLFPGTEVEPDPYERSTAQLVHEWRELTASRDQLRRAGFTLDDAVDQIRARLRAALHH
jgi:hypothetical protein